MYVDELALHPAVAGVPRHDVFFCYRLNCCAVLHEEVVFGAGVDHGEGAGAASAGSLGVVAALAREVWHRGVAGVAALLDLGGRAAVLLRLTALGEDVAAALRSATGEVTVGLAGDGYGGGVPLHPRGGEWSPEGSGDDVSVRELEERLDTQLCPGDGVVERGLGGGGCGGVVELEHERGIRLHLGGRSGSGENQAGAAEEPNTGCSAGVGGIDICT